MQIADQRLCVAHLHHEGGWTCSAQSQPQHHSTKTVLSTTSVWSHFSVDNSRLVALGSSRLVRLLQVTNSKLALGVVAPRQQPAGQNKQTQRQADNGGRWTGGFHPSPGKMLIHWNRPIYLGKFKASSNPKSSKSKIHLK